MKKVPPKIYQGLSPKQRTIAWIEAAARADEEEKKRLVRTCVKREYLQRDLRFTRAIDDLMNLALSVEADRKELLIRWLISVQVNPTASFDLLRELASVNEAWRLVLVEVGIDPAAMEKVGPPSSPWFEQLEPLLPKPDIELSKHLHAEMKSMLQLAS